MRASIAESVGTGSAAFCGGRSAIGSLDHDLADDAADRRRLDGQYEDKSPTSPIGISEDPGAMPVR